MKEIIDLLYRTFAEYPAGEVMGCSYCYEPADIERLKRTTIRELPRELACTLLYETGDHWESPEAYKHFLPRMLEVMAPPELEGDTYEGHLAQTLLYQGFKCWPAEERRVVLEALDQLEPHLEFLDPGARASWMKGRAALDGPALALEFRAGEWSDDSGGDA